ncbi:hypothetical protein Y032_0364g3565 [Ancylostoma ceylanicum]|uniref:Uncharacterized protein n=1 Tax=Ancylostoma ceylanicum TaxID=53326 RepID=A0A016RV18_9BILA|nr:hypothetical protein Y032_0364g3565 [Ancylostoma ceylanicum]
MGTYGLQWNEHGEGFPEFITTTKTIRGNSRFQKPTSLRWTWELPGGEYHNENDVAVVPKLYARSDHRLLRAKFFFSRKEEKGAKCKKYPPPLPLLQLLSVPSRVFISFSVPKPQQTP